MNFSRSACACAWAWPFWVRWVYVIVTAYPSLSLVYQ